MYVFQKGLQSEKERKPKRATNTKREGSVSMPIAFVFVAVALVALTIPLFILLKVVCGGLHIIRLREAGVSKVKR